MFEIKTKTMSKKIKRFLILPVLFFTFIISVGITGFFVSKNNLYKQTATELEIDVTRIIDSVNTRLNRDLYLLNSVTGLFAASDQVDRDEFYSFLDEVKISTNYPGIYAVGYLERIHKDDILKFETLIKEDVSFNEGGYPNFQIKTSGEIKDYYYPLKYAYPEEKLYNILGQDFSSDPIRQDAINKSIETSQPIVTSKVFTFTDNSSAINIFLPIYKNNSSKNPEDVMGFLIAVIKIDQFFPEILSENKNYSDLELHIYDKDIENKKEELFMDQHKSRNPYYHDNNSISKEVFVNFAQKEWVFNFFAKNKYGLSFIEKNTPLFIIFISILLSLLVFFIINGIIRRQERAEIIAEELFNKNRESEEKFRLITESAKDAIVMMNNVGRVVFWNRAAEEIFGYSSEEIIGKELHSIIPVKKEHLKNKIRLKKFGQTGETAVLNKPIELPVRRKDGGNLIIELTISRVKIKDVWHAIGIMRDVSQRKINEEIVKQKNNELTLKNKELENTKRGILNILEDIQEEKNISEILARDLEKFKLAVENASDHIVITDHDGVILYANRAVERITGFKPETIINKKAGNGDLWGGLMDLDFYKKLWNTIKNEKKVFSGEINNKRKNGDKYIALASISPVLDKNGNVSFFVGIERDITKEKEIDKAKTEFVSLASHQLRTPLSSINWYSEMLLAGDAGKLNKEQKQFVSEIYTGNQRMVELVNALLNVSRLELGTFIVEPVPTNLIEISESIIKELQPTILDKKLILKTSYDKTIGKINVDPALTRIIFQNLLSNATKYTPDKGKIFVSIKKNTKNVLIDIKDTGYGIPKSQQDKIFTKLFRADNVKEKDTEGTGLGLYIIKSIIDKSGGVISFISDENKGTKFHIELPLSGMKKKEGSRKLS